MKFSQWILTLLVLSVIVVQSAKLSVNVNVNVDDEASEPYSPPGYPYPPLCGLASPVPSSAIPSKKYILTLTNNGANATPDTFQQRVEVPLNSITKLSKDYSNVDFAYSSGRKVPAWLEKVDSSTNVATWWLRVNESIAPGHSLDVELLTHSSNVLGKTSGQNTALFSGYDNGAEVFFEYASFQGKSLPSNTKLSRIAPNFSYQASDDPAYSPVFIGGKTKSGGLLMTNSKGGESTAVKLSTPMTTALPQIIELSWSISNGTDENKLDADDIGVGFFSSDSIVHSGASRWSPYPSAGYYASFEFFENTPPALVYNQDFYPTEQQTLPTSGEHMMFSSIVVDKKGVEMAFASSPYETSDLYRYAPPSKEMKTCLTKQIDIDTTHTAFYVGASAAVDYSTIRLYFVRNYLLGLNVSSSFKSSA